MQYLNRVKRPWISEKATDLASSNKYVFLVEPKSKSHQIKEEIERIYKVNVVKLNIINIKKDGEKRKKAIATLKTGQSIDVTPH
ncbi:MAG: 50S ribosomal protein L23 [Candidatus Colwellbacteria bacterium]|nr:50S ribosomal protein L23 [Candidatus Colwellbacteria bacterium]